MKIVRLPKILTESEKKEFDTLVQKLCIKRKLNKKEDKRLEQLMDRWN